MRARGELFSDIAQVVNGAASALGGVREELRGMRQGYQERSQNAGSVVTREDFDAAISRIEALAARDHRAGSAARQGWQDRYKKDGHKKAAAKKQPNLQKHLNRWQQAQCGFSLKPQ